MSHPRARVTLPDGQELDVFVLGRERTADGWRYDLRLPLPDGQQADFSAAFPTVRPIEGEDYSALPGAPAAAAGQLLVASLQRAGEPLQVLHRADCWVAPAGALPVSEAEAGALVAAGARLCDVCLPGRPETWDGRT